MTDRLTGDAPAGPDGGPVPPGAAPGPDRLIGRRYRLVSPVGRGGLGRVWHAYDVLLDRDVAVKELILPPGLDPAGARAAHRRMIREARSAARLNHPGIAAVHDVAEEDGRPWIVMELVRGWSLEQAVRQGGPLPVAQAAEIGVRVLDALRQAHAAGILHRDVKPGNVLLTADRVVLTDFGLAALEDDGGAPLAGLLVGSPAYVPPERLTGRAATPAADLWAFGATLYTAVEGRPPYEGPDAMTVLNEILSGEPARPVRAGSLTPVLEGLLRRDPDGRMTAAEAARLLERALPVPSGPPAPSDPPGSSGLPGLPGLPGRDAEPSGHGAARAPLPAPTPQDPFPASPSPSAQDPFRAAPGQASFPSHSSQDPFPASSRQAPPAQDPFSTSSERLTAFGSQPSFPPDVPAVRPASSRTPSPGPMPSRIIETPSGPVRVPYDPQAASGAETAPFPGPPSDGPGGPPAGMRGYDALRSSSADFSSPFFGDPPPDAPAGTAGASPRPSGGNAPAVRGAAGASPRGRRHAAPEDPDPLGVRRNGRSGGRLTPRTLAAGGAVALLLVIVALVLLLPRSSDAPESPATTAGPGASAAVSTPADPGDTADPAAPDRPRTEVPDGYRRLSEAGVAAALPKGWTAKPGDDGGAVFTGPRDSGRSVTVTPVPVLDPMTALRRADRNGLDEYTEIGLSRAPYRDWKAADLEYTYAVSGGAVPMHGLTRYVAVDDATAYRITFAVQDLDWGKSSAFRQVFLDTFTPNA
ncbi:protein kinase [Streptosporangium sp. NPDC004379]|uniref:serine/threonine-protein kinase n=1 Tax=Streptosporangium sp. NPDC004379 TaxID=3366189 RepID=UPI0036CB108D